MERKEIKKKVLKELEKEGMVYPQLCTSLKIYKAVGMRELSFALTELLQEGKITILDLTYSLLQKAAV